MKEADVARVLNHFKVFGENALVTMHIDEIQVMELDVGKRLASKQKTLELLKEAYGKEKHWLEMADQAIEFLGSKI